MLHDCFVHPFWYTIFLSCSSNYLLSTSFMVWIIIIKILATLFTSIVWYEILYVLSYLVLDQSFLFPKSIKNISFICNIINPCFSIYIINKSNVILRAMRDDTWRGLHTYIWTISNFSLFFSFSNLRNLTILYFP